MAAALQELLQRHHVSRFKRGCFYAGRGHRLHQMRARVVSDFVGVFFGIRFSVPFFRNHRVPNPEVHCVWLRLVSLYNANILTFKHI
jgi:hypothetical protein